KRSVAIPQARAAASFDPSANTRRPNTVLRNTIAAHTARMIAIQTPGATSNHEGLGNITNNSFNQVSGMLTVCWLASHLAVPRATPSIPKVAIKGTTFKRVIARPFTTPTKPPTNTPIPRAQIGGRPAFTEIAVITPVKATVDP